MNPEPLEVIIKKAIYGTYCSIDLRKLQQAVNNHQMLKVTILSKGSAIVDPRWWYDTGTKEKRVVNYANRPMTFVYNHAPIQGKLKTNKNLSVDQMQLL